MSDLTCFDTLQLCMIIFGAIFSTLFVCILFVVVPVFFLSKRQPKFLEKIPGYEKFTELKNRAKTKQLFKKTKIHTESYGKQAPTPNYATNEKQQSVVFCSEKSDPNLSRNDSMEDIPLNDETILRKMSELKNENTTVKVISEIQTNKSDALDENPSLPSKSPPPLEHNNCNNEIKNFSNDNLDEAPNQSKNVVNQNKENISHSNETNNKIENETIDNNYNILTQEHCNVLEANRQRLDAERQQLRQLGLI